MSMSGDSRRTAGIHDGKRSLAASAVTDESDITGSEYGLSFLNIQRRLDNDAYRRAAELFLSSGEEEGNKKQL